MAVGQKDPKESPKSICSLVNEYSCGKDFDSITSLQAAEIREQAAKKQRNLNDARYFMGVIYFAGIL